MLWCCKACSQACVATGWIEHGTRPKVAFYLLEAFRTRCVRTVHIQNANWLRFGALAYQTPVLFVRRAGGRSKNRLQVSEPRADFKTDFQTWVTGAERMLRKGRTVDSRWLAEIRTQSAEDESEILFLLQQPRPNTID